MLEVKFEFLNNFNVDKYLSYLKIAFSQEPDFMFCDVIDEKSIRERVLDDFYKNTKSILAIVDDKVVGRIEYHFYGCLQNGFRMCYIDWVYVLKEYRKKGIAKKLFLELEKDCKINLINQYYLLCGTNDYANGFYSNFKDVEIETFSVLRKYLR